MTTCAAAAGIIASGTFRAGTYWAYDPADALGFAGPVLFVGRFDETLLRGADDEKKWQFLLREDVPLSAICTDMHWADAVA